MTTYAYNVNLFSGPVGDDEHKNIAASEFNALGSRAACESI